MHTYSSEQNWKYYGLSYSGVRRKWFMQRTVPQGFFFKMEGGLRRSLFAAKTLLTQWRGSLSRMRYYPTEGSNGEDDIDMEGSI